MTVQTIKYTNPVTGTSESNPTYIASGGDSQSSEGGATQMLVSDQTSRQLLESILIELKKLNLRQQEVFEETIKDEDVL